ncbi:MAG: metallophosphoesterase [Oscillospiraceae bacterium]|nr:metallophosphoesterase [Oscillospiraceae bacterium]
MKKIISVLLTVIMLLSFAGCNSDKNNLDVVVITDIHFAGNEFFHYEGYYAESNDTNGSGKQMKYLDDILDAFIDEMKTRKPDYILMTGDNTFDGAKESHFALTEKLRALVDEGITILNIPGNHDIKNTAYIFPNGGYEKTESLTPEEYREVYANFGYTGGISYDENSLSYVYDTGKGVRFFMMDTNASYGLLYGEIIKEKYEWLEKELSACIEAGDIPVVAGHHNLLEHNKMFNFGYMLNNSPDVVELLERYGVSLYLSGHMHTQHIAQNENITDIVGGAFSVYPHRYGIINFNKDGWTYKSKMTDVSAYAKKTESTDDSLLNYSDYGYAFFYNNAYKQGLEALSSVIKDPELLEKYADFSAKLNVAYFGGVFSDIDLSLSEQFIEDSAGTRWGFYMSYILNDTKDNVYCQHLYQTE